MEIVAEQLKCDEQSNETFLITKYEDGSISSRPITSEEASKWTAGHYY